MLGEVASVLFTRDRNRSERVAELSNAIDRGPEGGRGHGLSLGPRCFDPRDLRLQDLRQGFLGRTPEGGTVREIGNVGDVTAVLLARKDINVLILHDALPRERLCRSTSWSNSRIWYGLACPRTSWRFRSSGNRSWTKM